MKFSIQFALLLFIFGKTYCQNVVVSATKMNVLYADVDNPFSFAINNTDCNDYQLSSNNGVIKCDSNCNCAINPIKFGKITVIYIKDKTGKLIDSSEYRTKDLPDPVFEIDYTTGCRGPIVTKVRDSVLLKMKDFNFNPKFTTMHFEVSLYRNDTLVSSYLNVGDKISSEVKKIYSLENPGDILYIKDIIVVQPSGRARKLSNLGFKID
jgi:hypothetical protein